MPQTFLSLANANQYSASNTGTALNTSVTLTDISPGANTAGQAFTIAANSLYPGQIFEVYANGIYGTTGTPTLLLGVYYGAVAGTALAATAATTTASGVANGVWTLEAKCRVATVGTSGTILTIGSVLGIAATSANPTLMPATSANGGSATVNTSTANQLTIGAQWGTSSASNTITCYQFHVRALN